MAEVGIHIPNPADEAKKAINKIIKPAITAGEHAVNTVKDEAVKAVKDARAHGEWGVSHVRKEAEAALATVETDAKKAVADAGHAAADAVSVAGEDAEKAVHEAGDRAVAAFSEDLPKALHKLWDGIRAAIAGKVGDIAFAIADHVAPGREKIGLLFLEFEMDFREKLPVLRKWLVDPPTDGDQLRKMVSELTDYGVVILRPAKVPGLPYLGLDPRIPVEVAAIPSIMTTIEDKLQDIL